MLELVASGAALTMSSREMADLTQKRHDSVKRTIEMLVERGAVAQPQIVDGIRAANGVVEQLYLFGQRDSYVIVAQLSPEFTAAIVDRWQALETKPLSRLEVLERAVEVERRSLLLEAENKAQAEQLALAKPKSDFVDRYVVSDGLMGFRQVAKLLKVNEARFREFLIDKRIMYRLGDTLTAYQQHIDAGRFEVKAGMAAANDRSYTTTKFTAKGVNWITGEWAKAQLPAMAAAS